MKWIFTLIVVLLVVFVVVKRDQLYVRDPLGKVMHNGMEEKGAQVFINFQNEVFLENDNPPMHVALLQANNHVGVPKQMQCMHWMVCLMDAPVVTLADTLPWKVESMDSKQVVYHDAEGVQSVVTLR